jgi:Flp pilus assembly protein TadG
MKNRKNHQKDKNDLIISKKQEKQGQAMVEMALVLPIFIFIIIGIVDFGRVMHSMSNLNHQCIQGARAGSKRIRPLIAKNLFTNTTHPDTEAIVAAFWKNQSPIMNKSSYNVNSTNNEPKIEGWGKDSQSITVSATYDIEIITPIIGSLIGKENTSGRIRLSATATEKKE